MLGAADSNGRDGHAVDADRAAAVRAGEAGLAVGMAVAVLRLGHGVSVLAVRVHVAFTPAEEVSAPVGIVVDVLRATSTITQALAAGYRRVLCCAEVEEARAVAGCLQNIF